MTTELMMHCGEFATLRIESGYEDHIVRLTREGVNTGDDVRVTLFADHSQLAELLLHLCSVPDVVDCAVDLLPAVSSLGSAGDKNRAAQAIGAQRLRDKLCVLQVRGALTVEDGADHV